MDDIEWRKITDGFKKSSTSKRHSIYAFLNPDDGSLEPKRYNVTFFYIKFFSFD